MIDNSKAGALIAELRKRQNMTQTDLARIVNVTHQAVSKWEIGAALPDISTLLELSKLFGVAMESLVTGEYTFPDVQGTESAETGTSAEVKADIEAIAESETEVVEEAERKTDTATTEEIPARETHQRREAPIPPMPSVPPIPQIPPIPPIPPTPPTPPTPPQNNYDNIIPLLSELDVDAAVQMIGAISGTLSTNAVMRAIIEDGLDEDVAIALINKLGRPISAAVVIGQLPALDEDIALALIDRLEQPISAAVVIGQLPALDEDIALALIGRLEQPISAAVVIGQLPALDEDIAMALIEKLGQPISPAVIIGQLPALDEDIAIALIDRMSSNVRVENISHILPLLDDEVAVALMKKTDSQNTNANTDSNTNTYTWHDISDTVSDAVSSAFNSAKNAAGSVDWDQFSRSMDSFGRKMSEFGDNFGRNMGEWGDKFGEKMSDLGEKINRKVNEKLNRKFGTGQSMHESGTTSHESAAAPTSQNYEPIGEEGPVSFKNIKDLAPFVGKDGMIKLLERVEKPLTLSEFSKIAYALPREYIQEWVAKYEGQVDFEGVKKIAHCVDADGLKKLLLMVTPISIAQLSQIAYALPHEYLNELLDKALADSGK